MKQLLWPEPDAWRPGGAAPRTPHSRLRRLKEGSSPAGAVSLITAARSSPHGKQNWDPYSPAAKANAQLECEVAEELEGAAGGGGAAEL